jgi:phage terminase small subunit
MKQELLAAPLTIREEKFCFEYLATGGNGTQAFLRVNPLMTDGSAHVAANRLLRKATVQARIAELRQELASREVMSLAERRARLTAIGRGDQSDIWETLPGGRQRMRPLDEMTPQQRLAIQELIEEEGRYGPKRKVKLYSSVDAIDLLNRMDGLYRQTVVHTGELRHVMALPRKQPTDGEWLERYTPKLPPGLAPKLPASADSK